MSEPSNSSVHGLITSLTASGKSATAKGDGRLGTGQEDGKAFSRELNQALEKQSVVTPLTSGKPPASEVGLHTAAVDPAGSAGVRVEADSQESQEQLTSSVTVAIIEEALPVVESGQNVAQLPHSAEKFLATPTVSQTAGAVAREVFESPETVLAGMPETLPEGGAKDAPSLALLQSAAQAGQSSASEVADKAPLRLEQVVTTAVAGTGNPVQTVTDTDTGAYESDDVAVMASNFSAAVAPQTSAKPLTPAAPLAQSASLTATAPLAQSASMTATAPLSQAAPITATVQLEQSGTVRGVESQTLLAASEGKLVLPGSSDARIPATPTPDKHTAGNVAAPVTTSVVADSTINEELVTARPLPNAPPVQPAEVGEVISQASLSARYRFAKNDTGIRVSAPFSGGNETVAQGLPSSVDGHSVLTSQPVLVTGLAGNSLTAPGVEGKTEAGAVQPPVSVMPPVDGQPVLRHEDLLKDLQTQRAALNESISLPGTTSGMPPVEALVKSTSADNMFIPVTSGIVTAPVVPRTDAVTAAPVGAPFELPLMAEDADFAMASNLKWMVKAGVQNATVTVSPAGMGPISIKVGMEQDQMSVSIVASQHTTREALDAMLPRLREQLAGQGHESVKLDVSDGRGEQSRGGNGQMFAGTRNPSDTWTQGDQSNSGNNGNQTEYGDSNGSTVDSDRYMAEDLQRVALRAAAGSRTSSAFDAYV